MKSSLAILVPYYTNQLGEDEYYALKHLDYFLPNQDRYLLAPEGLEITAVRNQKYFQVFRFPSEYFIGTKSYSRLLLSSSFYRTFERYEYILIYQLDCLIFNSDIQFWLNKEYDYIGAPWLKNPQHAESGFTRVGNGGLSLRRIESFLRVLTSSRYSTQPVMFWKDLLKPVHDFDEPMLKFKLSWHSFKRRVRVLRQVRHGVQWYVSNYSLNEDRFWSDRAMFFYPDFKIAPVVDGLRFAFERFPRYCFEKNGYQLPFGSHAWAKWDRSFWQSHILPMDA